jgi:hypothetical protein
VNTGAGERPWMVSLKTECFKNGILDGFVFDPGGSNNQLENEADVIDMEPEASEALLTGKSEDEEKRKMFTTREIAEEIDHEMGEKVIIKNEISRLDKLIDLLAKEYGKISLKIL